ncbi:hypothetical protein VTJ83DRAFT_6634 [Remersonia thermophila]|uniref:RGS domain-containing protein n=1 Tax=Remersonia thermophila TaxID=72144 RepID=A0ABR4D669_9PEZI
MAYADSLTRSNAQRGDIPPELSFEEVIKNRAAPPCSLNDFMDYLLYVEHNAENLQFFLWYWDYVQRWSTLLPRQKALSPPWNPDQPGNPQSRFVKYSHRRERHQKMSKILAIMELESERTAAAAEAMSPLPPSPPLLRSPTTPASASPLPMSSILSPTEPNGPADWQPFTIPPNSSELTRITRHYLSPSSPRFLRLLPARDRETCLVASQHTTHPSALLPAFSAVEASLRDRSHPAFARWSLRNAGKARLDLVRAVAGLVVALGAVLDAVLALSGLPAPWRVVCLGLWWPAMVALWAAGRGVKGMPSRGSNNFNSAEKTRPGRAARSTSTSSTATTTTTTLTAAKATPSQYKPSLQVFGPPNDFSHEPWVAAHQAQGFWAKAVRQETVAVNNRALLAWQDRVVFVSVLWGGVVATAVTVASLFVPVGGLFWAS